MEILGYRRDVFRTSARSSYCGKDSRHFLSYGHPMRQSRYNRGITSAMSQGRTMDVNLLSGLYIICYVTVTSVFGENFAFLYKNFEMTHLSR